MYNRGGTFQDCDEKAWKPNDLVCFQNHKQFGWAGTSHSKSGVVGEETGKLKGGWQVLRKGHG